MELEFGFNKLHKTFVGFALLVFSRRGCDGPFDLGGELEFEEKQRARAVDQAGKMDRPLAER